MKDARDLLTMKKLDQLTQGRYTKFLKMFWRCHETILRGIIPTKTDNIGTRFHEVLECFQVVFNHNRIELKYQVRVCDHVDKVILSPPELIDPHERLFNNGNNGPISLEPLYHFLQGLVSGGVVRIRWII
jgi:hypothetical protein